MSNTGDPANVTITVPSTTAPPPQYPNGNTGTGFIVGATEPPARPAPMVQPQQNGPTADEIAAKVGEQINPTVTQQGQSIEEMRTQMAAMQAEIDTARGEREAAQKERDDAEAARLAAEQAAAEEKMSASELVGQVRTEMQAQFDQMRETAAAAQAILEQERHYNALQEYKASRLSDPDIAAVVMPHLHQYINGNSEQEIEEAIARAAATSNQIVGEFQQYQQTFRQQAVGVSPAAPTVGPLEAQPMQQTMSAAEIQALSPAEFARLRPQLLKAAGEQFRSNTGR